jgi:hypothetical protein
LFVLCKEGVDDSIEEGDEEEDESGVDDLHLVGLDDVAADLTVHPGSLKRPARSLQMVIVFK